MSYSISLEGNGIVGHDISILKVTAFAAHEPNCPWSIIAGKFGIIYDVGLTFEDLVVILFLIGTVIVDISKVESVGCRATLNAWSRLSFCCLNLYKNLCSIIYY
jgi:hypothetical protein